MSRTRQSSFLPHTSEDQAEMLKAIGASSIEELFESIPESIRGRALRLPEPLSEAQMLSEMRRFAESNRTHGKLFLGAGAYDHFIPSVVWPLVTRGEFLTAYTPYQPEVSQGTLQAAFEFQSLICELLGMEVANSSLYDGASALAEAVLMANRLVRNNRVLVPVTLHPAYRRVLETYVQSVGIELENIPESGGRTDLTALEALLKRPVSAVIVQQPNFLGQLEDATGISALTHAGEALLIASVYPLSCGVVAPPGEYDADIACGEGQPLGIPLSYGGPYFGFFATRNRFVRQMPGRLIGQTTDLEGRTGYVLTLQTREQHIRRDKSTSNICTNQFLCALASSVYLSALGKEGLIEVSRQCLEKSHYLRSLLLDLPGVEPVFEGPFFNEFAIRTPRRGKAILTALRERGIVGGYDLGQTDSGRKREILVCVTETRTRTDLDEYGRALKAILQ